MAFRRSRKSSKRSRKPRTFRRKSSIPRELTPPIFRFKRDIEQTLTLDNNSAPEGWTLANGGRQIYNTLGWSLGSTGLHSEFQALFRQYRIKGARVKMYFSNTNSGDQGGASAYSNSQMLIRMAPNSSGSPDALTADYWMQATAKKYKTALNGGRPIDVYMPLHQETLVQASTGVASPTVGKPKFVMTSVANIVHYGINMSIERVDGDVFSGGHSNTQKCRTITTLYFEFRGTH